MYRGENNRQQSLLPVRGHPLWKSDDLYLEARSDNNGDEIDNNPQIFN